MTTAVKIGGGSEWMHLHRVQFRWPWRCANAIQSASPDAAWPGLHWKPPDAVIGQLLAPYCPGGCQGNNQHNNNGTCTHFVGSFDGHCDATTTKYHHRASTDVSNISSWKRAPVDILAPNNNRGMTYQTDKKHLTNSGKYFVGMV